MTTTACLLILLLTQALVHLSDAFAPQRKKKLHCTARFGLVEWRGKVTRGEEGSSTGGDRPILLLPFEAEDALLPGQSRDLILKEGRLFDLVQDAMDDYDSVIGAALLGDDGFLDVISLAEIHNFDVHSGYRGKVTVSITLKALGRAEMTELTEMKPIMRGYCKEIVDDTVHNIASATCIVRDIEAIIDDLSRRKDWCGRRQLYDEAYSHIIESITSSSISRLDEDESLSKSFAASWAVFSVVRETSAFPDAMKIIDLVDRLRFGLKCVLAEKCQMAPIVNSNDAGVDIGFE